MQPISPVQIVSVLNAISFQFRGYDEKTSVAQSKLLHNTTVTEREQMTNSCPSAHVKLDSLQGRKEIVRKYMYMKIK